MDNAALIEALSPAMKHAIRRCSDALDWTHNKEVTWARDWADVTANYSHCTFRGTLRALERRGLVQIDADHGVRLTLKGLEIQRLLG